MTKTTWKPKLGTGLQQLKHRIDKGLWPYVQELKKRVDELELRVTRLDDPSRIGMAKGDETKEPLGKQPMP